MTERRIILELVCDVDEDAPDGLDPLDHVRDALWAYESGHRGAEGLGPVEVIRVGRVRFAEEADDG